MLSIEPRLLTPGPLALAPEVKASMQRDLGSRDLSFRHVTRDWIQALAGARPEHTVVPVQGSGTFAIEAALTTFVKELTTFVKESDQVLVCANGVYGETAAKILRRHRLPHAALLGLEAAAHGVPSNTGAPARCRALNRPPRPPARGRFGEA